MGIKKPPTFYIKLTPINFIYKIQISSAGGYYAVLNTCLLGFGKLIGTAKIMLKTIT